MGKKILAIDDDRSQLNLIKHYLTKSGYEILTIEDSTMALEKIVLFKPDALVVDLLMPKIDGFTLVKNIRGNKEFNPIKIIVVSSKTFEFDKKRAYELGADAYLEKPLKYEDLVETIERVLRDEIKVTFWGARGTFSKPGRGTLKFGGNTPCVSIELTKERLFIFDAGTGIVELGKYLDSFKRRYKMNLFISHPHWDHIHGLPFFMPIYRQGNEIVIYGSSHGNLSLREVISGTMGSIYFPVTIKEFASMVHFREISEGDYEIEGLSLNVILLNHPGITLGYKLTSSNGKSVAYITDNELPPEGVEGQDTHFRQKLVKFLSKVDVLIHDSSYFDDEYYSRVGWGHPSITAVLKLAAEAGIKNLYLFHHDPDHDDGKVTEKETFGKHYFEEHNLDIQCFAAVEGSSISLYSDTHPILSNSDICNEKGVYSHDAK